MLVNSGSAHFGKSDQFEGGVNKQENRSGSMRDSEPTFGVFVSSTPVFFAQSPGGTGCCRTAWLALGSTLSCMRGITP